MPGLYRTAWQEIHISPARLTWAVGFGLEDGFGTEALSKGKILIYN